MKETLTSSKKVQSRAIADMVVVGSGSRRKKGSRNTTIVPTKMIYLGQLVSKLERKVPNYI